jgi:hypothetical protein
VTEQVYCDRCGEQAGVGEHTACAHARELEPPRYCGVCRRRMVVQVTPSGWTATCSEHGTLGAHGTVGPPKGALVNRPESSP